MSDALIDQLTADLQPRAPLKLSRFALWLALLCVGLAVGVFATLGLRPDMGQHAPSVLKPAFYGLVCASSAGLLFWLSIPGSKAASWKYLSIAILTAGAAVLAYSAGQAGLAGLVEAARMPEATQCSIGVGGLGFIPLIMLMRWLKRAAPNNPEAIGMLAGLVSGSLAAAVHALHCPNDNVFYMFLWNGMPILLHMVIGGLVGRRYLRW